MGIVDVAPLQSQGRERADCDENIDLEVDEFCGDLCESVRAIVAITIFNDEVSILDQSTLSQPHDKCRDGALFYRQRPWNRSVEIADSEELPWLLRAHRSRVRPIGDRKFGRHRKATPLRSRLSSFRMAAHLRAPSMRPTSSFLPFGDVQPGAVGGGKCRFVLRPRRRLQQQREIFR